MPTIVQRLRKKINNCALALTGRKKDNAAIHLRTGKKINESLKKYNEKTKKYNAELAADAKKLKDLDRRYTNEAANDTVEYFANYYFDCYDCFVGNDEEATICDYIVKISACIAFLPCIILAMFISCVTNSPNDKKEGNCCDNDEPEITVIEKCTALIVLGFLFAITCTIVFGFPLAVIHKYVFAT